MCRPLNSWLSSTGSQEFRIAQHITQNREDAEEWSRVPDFKAYEKLEQFQGNSKVVLPLAGAHCGERVADAAAQAAYRAYRIDRRGRGDGGRLHAARPRRVEARPRDDVRAVGVGRDSAQDDRGFAARFSG